MWRSNDYAIITLDAAGKHHNGTVRAVEAAGCGLPHSLALAGLGNVKVGNQTRPTSRIRYRFPRVGLQRPFIAQEVNQRIRKTRSQGQDIRRECTQLCRWSV